MTQKILNVLFLCVFTSVSGYKILFLAPINAKSHWIYLENFVRALLKREHEVTCVTSIKLSEPIPKNYTEVLIDPPFDVASYVSQEQIYSTMAHASSFWTATAFPIFGYLSADFAMNNKNVQKLIHSDDIHFDLVINEEIYHDSFLMFGHKFNAPMVTICPYGVSDFFDRQMGLLTPWSHVPHSFSTYTDNMSFTQRWSNTLLSLYDWLLRTLIHIPLQNKIAKTNFAHLGSIPSINDLMKNVSLILVNAHRSITPPKPSMPGLIYIGGAHVKPTELLPNDIETFLDGAEAGAIYFSLGTHVQSSKMPQEKIIMFLEVFQTLKQRVIWKFEDELTVNIPSNVLIRKWLPQNNILAHPNIILFMSQGGMFSTFEAISHGIPMLMIPFVSDQYRNAVRLTNAGYGKYLNFQTITKESLLSSIQQMINDNSFSNKAKEISTIYGDNLVHPMEEAMFWIEYVCRHKGAKHLKSHAISMSWFSYLLIDVFLATIVGSVFIGFFIYFMLKRLCYGRKSNGKMKQT